MEKQKDIGHLKHGNACVSNCSFGLPVPKNAQPCLFSRAQSSHLSSLDPLPPPIHPPPIAVNASLLALSRLRIFCTEPFRIPLAGKVTTCCFDKTGTLTSDHFVLEGVVGCGAPEGGPEPEAGALQDAKSLPRATARVLTACQSLVQVREWRMGYLGNSERGTG